MATTPSPRRPQSAPSQRAGEPSFVGIRPVPLPPNGGVIHSHVTPQRTGSGAANAPHNNVYHSPRQYHTQRDVALALRERLLNLDKRRLYGGDAITRPRFQVSKRVDPATPTPSSLSSSVTPSLVPAPPSSSASGRGSDARPATAASASSAVADPNSSGNRNKPPFQIASCRKTIFDIQVGAARSETLQHTEPYVAPRPFSQVLRLPEDEAKEYYLAELEAGYYKRWVYGVNGERPKIPESVLHFFGDDRGFREQDDEATTKWRGNIAATVYQHQSQQHGDTHRPAQ